MTARPGRMRTRPWPACSGRAPPRASCRPAAPAPGRDPASFPAPRVEVVDRVGAGDAFIGALATALAAGLPLDTAVTAAVQAGAAACTGQGARQALPRAGDIPALRAAGLGRGRAD